MALKWPMNAARNATLRIRRVVLSLKGKNRKKRVKKFLKKAGKIGKNNAAQLTSTTIMALSSHIYEPSLGNSDPLG